jgi:branched-chain amino acid transport system ATP-binding protein
VLTLAGIQAGYSGMQVLFGIDIQVQEGEVAAILGANEAGKSTIL